jgi:gliding motility-associated-like protein
MGNFNIINLRLFLFALLFITALGAKAQCPLVSNSNQIFCASDNPLVEDLEISDQGGGVVWYTEPTGGSILGDNFKLLNGVTYYADNLTGTCPVRPSVTVSIFGEPPNNVAVATSRCASEQSTVADLNPSGANIEWYDAQFDGNLLSGSTPLVNGVTYWVQKTENGCTSIRLPTTVNLIDPGAPSGSSEQFFCADFSNPQVFTVGDLVANGSNIQWYDTPIITIPLDSSTPLVDGKTYYATQSTFPCESIGVLSVTAIIDILPNPGIDGSTSLCDDSSTLVNLFDLLGGAPDTGGSWTGPFETTNGWQGTLDTSSLSADTGSYEFTYTHLAQNSCDETSASVTLDIVEEANAGNDNSIEICSNAEVVNLFTLLGSEADPDGTWSPVLASGTGDFDPSIDAPGNYTYTVAPNGPCTEDDTATITVSVELAPSPGSNSSLSLCEDSSGLIDLFDELAGNPDTGGTWDGPLELINGYRGTLDTAVLNVGSLNFTYTVSGINQCADAVAVLTVIVTANPYAGEDNTVNLCSSSGTIDLFELLGANADTGGFWSPALVSGSNLFDPSIDNAGVYTYTTNAVAPCTQNDQAQVTVLIEQAPNAGTDTELDLCSSQGTIDLFAALGIGAESGGTWSPALNSGTNIFDPTTDASGIYTYTVAATSNCPEDSATVDINVFSQNNAGNDVVVELCTNDTPIDLFSLLTGDPDSGGSWSPALNSGTGLFDPGTDNAGVYVYTLAGNGICAEDTANVTVSLDIAPNAGNDTNVTICGNGVAIDLFSLLGPDADPGGVWSGPSELTNEDQGTFNPSENLGGNYVYTVPGNGGCQFASSTVSVDFINPIPVVVPDGHIFCRLDNPTIEDLISNIIPSSNGVINVYETEVGGTPLLLSDLLTDEFTYYIEELEQVSSCSGTDRLSIMVQLNEPETPILSETNANFCAVDQPTVNDLNGFIVSGTNVIWFNDASATVPLNPTDALQNQTYFAKDEDPFGCASRVSLPITIQIIDTAIPILNPQREEYCALDRASLSDLSNDVTLPNNSILRWYSTESSSEILDMSDLLMDSSTYYAASFDTITGCESSDRLMVRVDFTSCDPDEYDLLIPDGFSPNGDNINDVFDLKGAEFLYENYKIEIFNRYGNLVYEGNKNTPPWDGTSNKSSVFGNAELPSGVYFYVFYFNRNDIPPKQGHVYLNR